MKNFSAVLASPEHEEQYEMSKHAFVSPSPFYLVHARHNHVTSRTNTSTSSTISYSASSALRKKRVHFCVIVEEENDKEKNQRQSDQEKGQVPIISGNSDVTPVQPNIKRQMSAESRAKISAALKGRRKSDSHREKLRKRLSGDQNPMYGRKLSVETRAKISQALTARKRKIEDEQQLSELIDQQEQQRNVIIGHNKENGIGSDENTTSSASFTLSSSSSGNSTKSASETTEKNDSNLSSSSEIKGETNPISEKENLKRWRKFAENSRLVKSFQQGVDEEKKNGRKSRKGNDDMQDSDIDQVLKRVAKLMEPPENVARLIHNTHARGTTEINNSQNNNKNNNSNNSNNKNKNKIKNNNSHNHNNNNNNDRTNSEIIQQLNPNLDASVKVKAETRGRRKRKVEKSVLDRSKKTCDACQGNCLVDCPACVIGIGVITSKCATCYGSGGVFCSKCNGSGFTRLKPNPENSSSS